MTLHDTARGPVDYLSAAETARLVRTELRTAFPGVRFTVRSSSYSGGGSINVGWTDGPATADVRAIIDPFAGAGFDGMTDLKYPRTAYVLDGKVIGSRSPGSWGSINGWDSATEPDFPAGARAVSFGASFVFANRRVSPDVHAAALATIRSWGYDVDASGWCRTGYPGDTYDRAVAVALAAR